MYIYIYIYIYIHTQHMSAYMNMFVLSVVRELGGARKPFKVYNDICLY